MHEIGTGECSPRKRIASRMSSGPVEQLSPSASTPSAVSVVRTEEMSVPSSILPPFGSSETWVWIGTVRPVFSNASRAPKTAALTSRMSCAVSMRMTSTPPSTRPSACSAKISRSSAKVMLPRVGSSEAGSIPVGPIEPTTKRSSPARGAADLGGLAVDLERVLAQPPLVELEAAGLEGVGLDGLGAGLEHRLVHALDDVGAVQDERLVALAGEPAVVLGGEVVLLQGGAHATVEDDDVGADGFEVVTHKQIMRVQAGP